METRLRLAVPIALLALIAFACGGGDEATEAGGGDDTMEEMSLAITAPEDGAEVTVPFTLQFDSSVPLADIDTGEHHVHVWYDGDDGNYEVVTSDTFEVASLSPGEHTITVSLRNADHSEAGVEEEITVTVTGGETGEGTEEDDTGYGY